ncbi:MAG TPA: hypothetical protein VKS81_01215, partial [Bacteroidota bacterium]|nr:hypothetical protein [Bacteroidota bacterium]
NGIYRTSDGGATFSNFSTFADPNSHALLTSAVAYTAAVVGDTIFVGTGDGTVSTIDNASNLFGSSWTVYRTYQPTTSAQTGTYAYPNPFSPSLEAVRIHYRVACPGNCIEGASQTVDIDVFDFAMNRVRTLLHGASRDIGIGSYKEYDELWDGQTDGGKQAANGVYFYRVKVGNADPFYGKILVLQ